MLELVSGAAGERDARPERQSSWLSGLGLRKRLAGLTRPLRLCFAGFVFLHFSWQAYRAFTAGALPAADFERTPWLVAGLFALLWLPFSVLGVQQVSRTSSLARSKALQGQARALAVIEPLALVLVLVFGGMHGAQMTWSLLSGALDSADLRAELIADLSGTWRGLPMQGMVYLCAVGAAAFCAARSSLALLPAGRLGLSRAVIGLAVLAYLLGSYAVIRCGSGSLLP